MGKCGARCIPKRTIYKELTKTIKTRCIKNKNKNKSNVPIFKIMILFMETQMCACCDVNWAGNMDDHKFTSNYVFFLGNGDINYNIKK